MIGNVAAPVYPGAATFLLYYALSVFDYAKLNSIGYSHISADKEILKTDIWSWEVPSEVSTRIHTVKEE